MPRKPKKPCAFQGCRNLTEGKYCEEHDHLRKESYVEYNRTRRDQNSATFYGSAAWKNLRSAYRRAHPLCEECLRHGRHTPASMVDHIIPIRQGGEKLDESNLQSLCNDCHERKSIAEGSRF